MIDTIDLSSDACVYCRRSTALLFRVGKSVSAGSAYNCTGRWDVSALLSSHDLISSRPLTTFYLYIFIYTPPMKSIRKSFGSSKETHISSPLPPLSKPALAIQPPIKVIRALQSHKSQSPHQLSFEKGDFFHVLKDPEDGLWYEASNPSTSARGLVPVHMFEEFLKGSATCVCL